MTIKQQGGIFGRNPTFNNLDVDGLANFNDTVRISKSSGNLLELYDADGGQDASTFSVTNGGRDMTIFAPQDTIFTQDGLETARFLNGGGLTFNGDTAAANALDDYEEGSWSPSYAPTSGSFTTMTYNNQEGYYTKIGDLVYINCLISTSNSNPSGGSGTLFISGLPYACGASADHSLAISGAVNWGGDYPLAGQVVESSSTIKFQYRTAVNGTTSSLDVSDMATSTSSNRNYIRFSGCYKV